MKYLALLILCLFSVIGGLGIALAFWSWPAGCIACGFLLALSFDVCFSESGN